MEKKIVENFWIPRRVVYVMVGILFLLGVVCNVVLLVKGNKVDLFSLLVPGGFIFAFFELRFYRRFNTTWLLTDRGLQRVPPSGPTETILWNQIQEMIVRPKGLSIKWRTAKLDGEDEDEESLWITGAGAEELVSLWKRNNSRGETAGGGS